MMEDVDKSEVLFKAFLLDSAFATISVSKKRPVLTGRVCESEGQP